MCLSLCLCVCVSVCVSVCSACKSEGARALEKGRDSLFEFEVEGEKVRFEREGENGEEEEEEDACYSGQFCDVGLSWATVPALCRGLPVQAWVSHVSSQALPPLVRTRGQELQEMTLGTRLNGARVPAVFSKSPKTDVFINYTFITHVLSRCVGGSISRT